MYQDLELLASVKPEGFVHDVAAGVWSFQVCMCMHMQDVESVTRQLPHDAKIRLLTTEIRLVTVTAKTPPLSSHRACPISTCILSYSPINTFIPFQPRIRASASTPCSIHPFGNRQRRIGSRDCSQGSSKEVVLALGRAVFPSLLASTFDPAWDSCLPGL